MMDQETRDLNILLNYVGMGPIEAQRALGRLIADRVTAELIAVENAKQLNISEYSGACKDERINYQNERLRILQKERNECVKDADR